MKHDKIKHIVALIRNHDHNRANVILDTVPDKTGQSWKILNTINTITQERWNIEQAKLSAEALEVQERINTKRLQGAMKLADWSK